MMFPRIGVKVKWSTSLECPGKITTSS